MAKPEYIAIVDHNSDHNKEWSYVKLDSTDKAFAFAEGAIKGFAVGNAYCVHICKRVSKRDIQYKSLGIIYEYGTIRSVDDWSDNSRTWNVWETDFEKMIKA